MLENVRNHLRVGWDLVVGDLHRLGYDVRWTLTLAAHVGAPHNRARLFAVARLRSAGGFPAPRHQPLAVVKPDATWDVADSLLRHDPYRGARPKHGAQVGGHVWATAAPPPPAPAGPLLPTPAVNDMGEGKTVRWWDDWCAVQKAKHGNGNGHGNSLAVELLRLDGPEPAFGRYAPAVAAWAARTRPAPAPTVDGRSNPAFPEWMMGLPDGWITDPAIWTGLSDTVVRRAQLKAAGNGVVPQQAEAALVRLLR